MSKLRFRISMSLDGYVAGPDQSVENPLGIGGENLHEWVFPLRFWREMQGKPGGEVNASDQFLRDSHANIGATIMGRNMFGGHPGPWKASNPWNGWWGKNPPYHRPVFVITHHPREPLRLEGGNTFNFVTDGIESALEQARRVTGEKDVEFVGGAAVANEYLNAGLIDEMDLSVAPILLGAGARMFDGVGDALRHFALERTVAEPKVTHYKFIRR
ncbi:MAG TPA: dihydrofolate reductase family protein [Gemmatimonadaceae bacterium]|nr:dihydrofolate reductase family protein [Gemmatimonadaceae bacterium]